MAYLCYCIDGPGAAELRQQHMPDHLAYIETILDQLAIAGPLREAAGATPVGSCLIYLTEDRSTALKLLQADPYFRAGVWKSTTCEHFAAAAGSWIGGTIW